MDRMGRIIRHGAGAVMRAEKAGEKGMERVGRDTRVVGGNNNHVCMRMP